MNQSTILLIGSGGREHAIAWKLAQSTKGGEIISAPGNPGMSQFGPLREVDVESPEAVVRLARECNPDLVVIGPEAPVAAGVSDALRDAGFAVFGPSREAGQLEWDKEYAKEFMKRHQIPTASFRTFSPDEKEEGRTLLSSHPMPVVLKASGLAAGKGVVIAKSVEEAIETFEDMLSGDAFGDAGMTVVVEEFMAGEEASIFAVTDGTHYVLFAPSQDHKRIGDNDTGPNTGGMGAYAPAPVVTEEILRRVQSEIIEPTLQGMREEGRLYQGCLFVGVMIDAAGNPRVVEYNCRFGDPETQVILPIWKGDLFDLFERVAKGDLSGVERYESKGSAVCIVLASGGYPGSYQKGKRIHLPEETETPDGIIIFHAGTKSVEQSDGSEELQTSGGRVLGVTAVSEEENLEETIQRAYQGVELVQFEGMTFRSDIGAKGLQRTERVGSDR